MPDKEIQARSALKLNDLDQLLGGIFKSRKVDLTVRDDLRVPMDQGNGFYKAINKSAAGGQFRNS